MPWRSWMAQPPHHERKNLKGMGLKRPAAGCSPHCISRSAGDSSGFFCCRGGASLTCFAEKLVLLIAGMLAPVVWLVMQVLLGSPATPMPLILSPLLGVGGYFLTDLRLSKASRHVRRSTAESVHTFFDLVALERLANASATQAVTQAATISDAPLFRRMAAGLERCRLEQTTPWRELHSIADEWDLPELGDFADIMRLEEQGAALAETLQARVRELREAHLSQQRTRAQEDTEALTIWMTLPALILGLTFIIPPLFILVGR